MKNKTGEELNHIFIYGTLMKDYENYKKFSLSEKLNYIGKGKLNGTMYDLGDYPGIIINDQDSSIKGELYKIKDQRILRDLDEFECYHPDSVKESLYIRKEVQLTKPSIKSWCYIYNKSINNKNKIKSGDWRSYNKD